MSLMERYIFRRVTSAFFLALAVLTGTLWMTQVLKELDVVTAKGQTIWIFLVMTFLAMPALIQVIAPIAFLIATVFVLNGLNSDSEMPAMTAAGASRWTIARPVFVLAFLVTLAVSLLHNVISPISLSGLRLMIIQVRADLIATLVKDGGFRTVEDGLTIHIREKAPDGRFLGIFVSDDRKPEESLQYIAKTGVLLESEQGTFLVMEDGDLVRYEADSQSTSVVAFETYGFDLSQFTNTGSNLLIKPRERVTMNLFGITPDDPYRKKFPNRFAAEIHERLTAPLYPLAFAPILLAFLGRPRTNRQDRGFAIVTVIAICVLLRGAGFAVVAAVNSSQALIPALYAVPLLGMAAGLFTLASNARLRMPRFAETISDIAWNAYRNIGDRFRPNQPTGGAAT
jgi:lipopolysaccharide export system permease protein